MRLSRSNYRTLAVVGAALALGVASVMVYDGSAGAASHGVDLRQPRACWDTTHTVAPTTTTTAPVTTTTTTAPATSTGIPTKSLPIIMGGVIEALTRAEAGEHIACAKH